MPNSGAKRLRMFNYCSFHKIGQPEYEFDLLSHQDPGTSAFWKVKTEESSDINHADWYTVTSILRHHSNSITSSTTNVLTKHNIPEDSNLQRHYHKNLKSHILKLMPESLFLYNHFSHRYLTSKQSQCVPHFDTRLGTQYGSRSLELQSRRTYAQPHFIEAIQRFTTLILETDCDV
jgi:hypothetical protein